MVISDLGAILKKGFEIDGLEDGAGKLPTGNQNLQSKKTSYNNTQKCGNAIHGHSKQTQLRG